jgi:hypothetical protein
MTLVSDHATSNISMMVLSFPNFVLAYYRQGWSSVLYTDQDSDSTVEGSSEGCWNFSCNANFPEIVKHMLMKQLYEFLHVIEIRWLSSNLPLYLSLDSRYFKWGQKSEN